MEGLQPQEEGASFLPHQEKGPEYITSAAIKLPGMDTPLTATRHALITQNLLTTEQLEQIENLSDSDAHKAYGYMTSTGRYVSGEEARVIATTNGQIEEGQTIESLYKFPGSETIH